MIDYAIGGVDKMSAAVVREAVEKHRDEVEDRIHKMYPRSGDVLLGAENALACLVALVEGKEWP